MWKGQKPSKTTTGTMESLRTKRHSRGNTILSLWITMIFMVVLFAQISIFETEKRVAVLHDINEERSLIPQSRSKESLLSYQQSLGFFDDIPDEVWIEFYQKRARNANHIFRESLLNQQWAQPPFFLINNFEPVFSCPHVRRIGELGDGPKWVCDPHRLRHQLGCLVYSIGSAGQTSFEDGLVKELGDVCEIHVFDPQDFSNVFANRANMYFHPWGLKGSEETSSNSRLYKPVKGAQFKSLQEMQRDLGHENRTISILKVDCEGCEFAAQNDFFKVDVRQLLLETHSLPQANSSVNPVEFFHRFEENGFVMFYKEFNNFPVSRWRNSCAEWAFLKVSPDFLGRDHTHKRIHMLAPGTRLSSSSTIVISSSRTGSVSTAKLVSKGVDKHGKAYTVRYLPGKS